MQFILIIDVACGSDNLGAHTCAVSSKGKLYSWGVGGTVGNNSMTSSGSNGSNAGSSNGNSSSGAREPQPWPPPRGGDKAGTDAWRHPPAERNGGAPRPPGRSSPIRPADVVSPLGVGHGGVTVTVGRDGVARRNHARAAAAAASVPSSPWSNGGVLRPEKSPFLPSRSGVVRPPALRPPAAGGARG